ncbi:neprilysin-11-like isoform X2 [Centruroides sculpturatus]|uniref:neprilysin-11-like isoform X2 n=1 Tax=Centruroides sculpturatus TaxID=218467 RepID=UPI000C6CCF39|nr:neprilysin-11-like isoform X2 [Centruroides sculpturatus]
MTRDNSVENEGTTAGLKWTCLKIIAFIIIAIIIIYVIVVRLTSSDRTTTSIRIPFQIWHPDDEDLKSHNNISRSDKFHKLGERLSSSLDHSVSPCDDFYKFACGNRFKNIKISESINEFQILQFKIYSTLKNIFESKLPNLPHAVQQAVTAYKSCINVKQLGGWPLGNFHFNERNYGIIRGIAVGIKKMGVMPLIKFSVLPNDENTMENLVTLDGPELTKIDISNNEAALLLLSLAEMLGEKNKNKITDDYLEMIELQKLITNAIQNSTKNSPSIKITMGELDKMFPKVNIIELLQTITNDSLENDFIRPDDKIAVNNIIYLSTILSSIENGNISKRALANYIGSNLILSNPFLVISYVQLANRRVKREIIKYTSEENYWISCLVLTTNTLSFAVDYLYIKQQRNDPDLLIQKQTEMISFLREAFEKLVKKSVWLDNETLTTILKKLHSMRDLINYPAWIMDSKKLNDYYQSLPTLNKDFAENLINLKVFRLEKNIKLLRKNNTSWPENFLSTTIVNAAYLLERNKMYIPLAVLNYPFFDLDAPWYFNFGALGAIIGHEITHGFDIEGSKRDETGSIRNWWTEKSKQEYVKRTNCLKGKYNNYVIPETNLKINGSKTLSENIADSSGIQQAFLAYKNWEEKYGKELSLPHMTQYSPYQILFISYSQIWCSKSSEEFKKTVLDKDVHSLNRYRVIGPLSNFASFSEVFQCKDDSLMNPAKKCVVW